jgi:hypothetical protein
MELESALKSEVERVLRAAEAAAVEVAAPRPWYARWTGWLLGLVV